MNPRYGIIEKKMYQVNAMKPKFEVGDEVWVYRGLDSEYFSGPQCDTVKEINTVGGPHYLLRNYLRVDGEGYFDYWASLFPESSLYASKEEAVRDMLVEIRAEMATHIVSYNKFAAMVRKFEQTEGNSNE